ncbi:MAG: peptidoglycan-binding protein [Clostridiales bacterium]|nr:peptidoglycan-binding protein [Clostridiales bacterium]
MQRQPMNKAQRWTLVFSLMIIILLAVLYLLFFSDNGSDVPRSSPEPTATFLTVDEARENLPTPTPTPSPSPSPTPLPTATPEPTHTPVPEKVVSLKKGSKGTEVVDLQTRLIELGYLKEGSNDGDYGSGTEAAVKAFQAKHNLKTDGIAGKDTQNALYSKDALPK